MTTPYDPMPAILDAVRTAATLDIEHVILGPAPGDLTPPYVVIRSVGGPPREAQVPHQRRRVDILAFDRRASLANALSNKIHAALFDRTPGTGVVSLPAIFDESGPIDLTDDDRRIPFVQRSYFVLYGEG